MVESDQISSKPPVTVPQDLLMRSSQVSQKLLWIVLESSHNDCECAVCKKVREIGLDVQALLGG